jgi:hypothetical protein
MINSSVVAEACEKVALKNYYYICDILAGVKININMGFKLSPRVVLFVYLQPCNSLKL